MVNSADLRHRLVAEVKQVASDLGRVPTREEFREHSKLGEKAYRRLFGGYSLLLQAAGLSKVAIKFDPSEAFQAPVEKPVYPNHTIVPKSGTYDLKFGSSKKILILGDTHFPWVNMDALCGVYAFIEANPEIDTVIQMGDLYDMYSWAKFPRSHLLYNPQEEIKVAREMAGEMWAKVQAMLPRARCVQLLGNHDIRPIKKCLEFAPELEPFLEFKKFFEFPGVELVQDHRHPFELGGVGFIHGFLGGLGAHARKFLRSIVCGHTHKGGVVTVPLADGTVLFECNAGYLGDPTSRPMSYTPTKMNEWTPGFAYLDEWGPRFIPL